MLATKGGFEVCIHNFKASSKFLNVWAKTVLSYWCALLMKFLDSRVLNWWNVFKVDHWLNSPLRILDVLFMNLTENQTIPTRTTFCFLFRQFSQFHVTSRDSFDSLIESCLVWVLARILKMSESDFKKTSTISSFSIVMKRRVAH